MTFSFSRRVDAPTSGSLGRGFVSERAHQWDRWVDCDEVALPRLAFRKVGCDTATRVWNTSLHLAVVASDVLLDSELSEQSSSMRHGRLHSSDSPDMVEQNWTPQLVCAQPGAGACPFCAAHFLLCAAGLAQLGRELVQVPLRFLLSVGGAFLKKSASAVAKDATPSWSRSLRLSRSLRFSLECPWWPRCRPSWLP